MKIILLSSAGQGVGKSTTAKLYKEHLNNSIQILPVVDPMRKHLNYIMKDIVGDLDFMTYYNKDHKSRRLSDLCPEYPDLILRQFLNIYSNCIQEVFGTDVWAKQFVKAIEQKFVICDDWRREIEYNYLVSKFGKENILTVNLIKGENKSKDLDPISTKLENQLVDFPFDLVFNFTDNWENITDLFKLLDNFINK